MNSKIKIRAMPRFYESSADRLVYTGNVANENYWDQHWDNQRLNTIYPKSVSQYNFTVYQTSKYLSPGSKVLEGGCGLATISWALHLHGYDVTALDYAQETINFLQQNLAELPCVLGDVRNSGFSDNYFDAYWSIGVIEHFYDNYDAIAEDMLRIINKSGYLFLTFPYMSPFRKLKTFCRFFSEWQSALHREKFYQFALNHKKVVGHYEKLGFKLVDTVPFDAFKGLKEEIGILGKLMQPIYDSKHIFSRILRKIIELCFCRFCSHSVLLVLQKL